MTTDLSGKTNWCRLKSLLNFVNRNSLQLMLLVRLIKHALSPLQING